MQVLAHTGPSWHSSALATHPHQPLLALAVRTTVLLYTPSGSLEAELRSTGRGCVTSVHFCSAPALTHLLVVGTTNGFVRVFDWESRRVFRTVCEPPSGEVNAVFAARFVPQFPNVLVVVWQGGNVKWFRIEKGGRKIGEFRLPFTHVLGVEVVGGKWDVMLVSGDDDYGGTVVKLDMTKIGRMAIVTRGECIYGMSATAIRSGANERILLAAKGSCAGPPLLFESPDAEKWSLVASQTTQQTDDRKKFNCAVAWCGSDRVITSDPGGLLVTWRLEESLNFTRTDSLQTAHMRQVFAIKRVHGLDCLAFASISMDRTMSVWKMAVFDGVEKWHLNYSSPRVTGPVRSIAFTSRDFHIPEGGGVSSGIAKFISFCHGGAVTVLELSEDEGNCVLVGEIKPFGNLGESDSASMIHSVCTSNHVTDEGASLSAPMFTFVSVDGQVGAIRVNEKREIESFLSKKRKRRPDDHKGAKCMELTSVASDTVVSVAENGDVVEWRLCCGENNKSKVGQRIAITSQNSYSLRAFGEIGSAGRVVLPIRIEHCNEYAFLICCGDGSVAIYSRTGHPLLPPFMTSLQNITCAAFSGRCGLVAVADTTGSLVTFNVRSPSLFQECEATKRAENVQRHDDFREPLTFLSWSPEPDETLLPSPGVGLYLAGITSKGESVVFMSDEQVRIVLRTRLRGHSRNVCLVRWESSNFLLTAGVDGTVRRWNISKQPWPSAGNQGL